MYDHFEEQRAFQSEENIISIHYQVWNSDFKLGRQLLLHLKLVATQLGELAELFLALGMDCGTDCVNTDDPLHDFISLLG